MTSFYEVFTRLTLSAELLPNIVEFQPPFSKPDRENAQTLAGRRNSIRLAC